MTEQTNDKKLLSPKADVLAKLDYDRVQNVGKP